MINTPHLSWRSECCGVSLSEVSVLQRNHLIVSCSYMDHSHNNIFHLWILWYVSRHELLLGNHCASLTSNTLNSSDRADDSFCWVWFCKCLSVLWLHKYLHHSGVGTMPHTNPRVSLSSSEERLRRNHHLGICFNYSNGGNEPSHQIWRKAKRVQGTRLIILMKHWECVTGTERQSAIHLLYWSSNQISS